MTAKKLETVEFGRGIAACAVVAFHANASAAYIGLEQSIWASPLQNGVDFFFVLSGFIIVHVHQAHMGRPELALSYLWKRTVRLLPLLWIVVGGWVIVRTAVVEMPDINAIATSLLLYPSLIEPVPIVVWTLRHEVLFYLVFCLALLNRRLGMAVFALWVIAVVAQLVLIALDQPVRGLPSFFLSSFVLDFLFGAIIAVLGPTILVRSWLPLITGIVAVLVLGWVSVQFDLGRLSTLDYTSTRNLFVPVNGLGFALLLYGMLCIENRVTVPRWSVLLGAASYAIYLVHTPINSFVQLVAVRLGNGLGHFLIFATGIAAGVVVHLVLEKRMLGLLRRFGPTLALVNRPVPE